MASRVGLASACFCTMNSYVLVVYHMCIEKWQCLLAFQTV